jgi:hypothetical protein
MSISFEEYINTQSNFEKKHFQCVSTDALIDMFGSNVTFDELYKHIKNEDCVDLKVAIKIYEDLDNLKIVTVWINDEFTADIKLEKHNHPIMFSYFDQLDIDEEDV